MLLAIALIALPPVAWVVTAASVANLYPTCHGTLEKVPHDARIGSGSDSMFPTDSDVGGFSLHLDGKRVVRMEGDCECGRVTLNDDEVSGLGGLFKKVSTDTWEYVDSSPSGEVPVTQFRTVPRASRHFQRSRILSPRHLPAFVTLFALGALAFAIVRARRGIVYVTRMTKWDEGTLDADGRIETDTGERLGMLGGAAPIVAGSILISPKARTKTDAYREMPVIDRGRVAFGTHQAWRGATTKSLREASTLVIMSALTTGAALAVHLLHG